MNASNSTPETAASTEQTDGQQPGKQTQGASRGQIKVDDRHVNACYSNFCRVTGTPEELILDFGLNAQPFSEQSEPVMISQRVVMNYYTAKRMLSALQMTVQRHETAFGLLETNIQKRVVPGAAPASLPLE